jgi:cytochrome c biogenesis protein ResB
MNEKRGGAAPEMAKGGEKGPYRVEFMGTVPGHVTYLGFMRDPSVGWLFTGVIIVILGTVVAFVINYRETWAWYDEENDRLYMATQVRGTSPAAHREFDRIAVEAARMSTGNTG